jgi:hypothetical protein
MRQGFWGFAMLAIGLFFAFGLWSGLQTGRLKLRSQAVDRSITPVWFWIIAFCYALAAVVAIGAGVVFLRAAMSAGS